ncbi:MAG: hypothetical protein Q9161_004351 [Pseudevernia consocians]
MAPKKATVVWVPGLLHTRAHFSPVMKALADVGIPSISIDMPNYGPSAPSALPYDDLKAIRSACSDLVNEGKEVILVAHSYTGVPVCQAVGGMQRSLRKSEGKDGGIIRAIFVAAFLVPEGVSTLEYMGGNLPPPWATSDGKIWRPNRDECMAEFFQDLPVEEQEHWADELVIANHNFCTTPVGKACWDLDVAKTYVSTTIDIAMPVVQQHAMMKPLWDQTWNIDEIEAGHAPFLSKIGELVKILEKYA